MTSPNPIFYLGWFFFLKPFKLIAMTKIARRAMLLNLKIRKGVQLKCITLETLSQEVVVGLMGVTIMQ